MKKNFTRLVCVGLWIAFCFVAVAQQSTLQMSENGFMLQQNEVELRIGENKWPAVWPDSIITYRLGEKSTKRELSESTNNSVKYIYYFWNMLNNAWVVSQQDGVTHTNNDKCYLDPHIEIVDDRSTIWLPQINTHMRLYLSGPSNHTYNVNRNNNGQITYAEGNMYSVSITYNTRRQISSVIHHTPQGVHTYQYQYDENGNFISFINPFRLEQAALYDSQGRIIRDYYYSGLSEFNLFSVYYYSDGNTSIMEPENNNPVGSNNQGSFELTPPISVDSLYNGSFVVQLPDGFTLDENNTGLTIEFSDLFDLRITRQENNCWQFEILPKTLRSVSLRTDEVTKMLKVAYTVDEKVKQGTYSIAINSILFETKGGNEIPEPAFTVPSVVERLGVTNEQIESAGTILYLIDQTLYIQSKKTERITIYSIMGQKLYETAIQTGLNSISATNFPQGILIVKGSSGWTEKLIIR